MLVKIFKIKDCKGRAVGAEFLANGRTDRYSEADGPLSQFCHRVIKSPTAHCFVSFVIHGVR